MPQEQPKYKRPPGYYRVQWNDNLWTIEEWKGWYWAHFKGYGPVLKQIDETPVPAEPIPIPDAAVLRSALEKIMNHKESGSFDKWYQTIVNIAREALAATGDGWIRCEDQKPELNKLVWFGWEDDKSVDLGRMVPGTPYLEEEPVYEADIPRFGMYINPPTHWKPYIIPSPPLNK